MSQRGAALLIILLILAAAGFVALFLVSQGIVKNILPEVSRPFRNSQVQIQTQYANPFDKGTQYINPFSNYKNPFDSLK